MFFSARPDDMLKAVAAHTGLDEPDILSPDRAPRLVAARWLLVRLLREECHMSQAAIGAYLGLDHTTVFHHLHRDRPELVEDLAVLKRARMHEDDAERLAAIKDLAARQKAHDEAVAAQAQSMAQELEELRNATAY